MEQIILNATKRVLTGRQTGKLRTSGKLPAVLYGHNVPTQSLEVNERDFLQVFKQAGESTIVRLVVDGDPKPVLIHEVQPHFLYDHPIHADFYAINMTEKLHAKIPLRFVGESAAVKTQGGILVKNHQEVEVECLPADLPKFIEVDIGALNTFEDAIRVSDLKASEQVKILTNAQDFVANVIPPRSEEELKELEQAPVAEDVTKVEGVVKPEVSAEGEGGVKAEDGKEKEKEKMPKVKE